jgi:hypothetical protein
MNDASSAQYQKKIVAGDVSSVAIIFWWLKNQD